MDALVDGGAPWPAAVAVSGGGDSLALMHLLAGWAAGSGRPLPVVLIVDHGLRKGSAADARKVHRWARAAKLKAHILTWTGPHPSNGLEAAAREARYRLMGNWLRKRKLGGLYVAHSEDDQAETFLLRLMRGSGVDGLAAMRAHAAYPLAEFGDLSVVRPLLGVSRAQLRAHLSATGSAWLDDPMNQEDRFARVRMRKLLPALAEIGLTPARIAGAARHLSRARQALEVATLAVVSRAARPGEDGFQIDAAALTSAPRELGLRALSQLLMAVSGEPYRPRFERLERLYDRLAGGTLGGGATLHGCRLSPAPKGRGVFGRGTWLLTREKPRRSRSKPIVSR
jgi:tRNA(Ile)-lysidine synthase